MHTVTQTLFFCFQSHSSSFEVKSFCNTNAFLLQERKSHPHVLVERVECISKRNGMQAHKSKMLLPFFTWQHGMVRKSSWLCKSDFRHFGLTKGLPVTKTVMRQELLVESRCAKKLALKICLKDVISEGGKRQSILAFPKKLKLIEILAPRLLPKNSCKFATQLLKHKWVW